MDDDNRYCIGCFRTLEEIKQWATLSETERQTIMAQLDTRSGV